MSTDPVQAGHGRSGDEAGTPPQPAAIRSGSPSPAGTLPPATLPPVIEGQVLPVREVDVLAFERQWWRHAGAKESAIRERFGLSATRYYQVLNALIDRPEALAADPLLVRRLRRVRAARARQRSARVLGTRPESD